MRAEHGVDVTAENVIIGSGAKIFEQLFCEAFLSPGDGVLVFSPYFPTYLPNIGRRVLGLAGGSAFGGSFPAADRRSPTVSENRSRAPRPFFSTAPTTPRAESPRLKTCGPWRTWYAARCGHFQ